jgi:tetratricopeptide (TPR) repeat protein
MKILILAALAALQPIPAEPPTAAEQRIFTITGYVDGTGEEDGGWFELAQTNQRFRLPANPGEHDTYVLLLAAASERGVALSVRYDASAGRADAAGGYVEYPLCAMAAANGASFGAEAANCPLRPAPSRETGERSLALGLAQAVGEPAAARRSLGEAIADSRLAPSLRALALRARGEAGENIAFRLPWAGEASDRASLDALADYRDWVAADPSDPMAQYATARILADLGGYEEAMAIYRAIERRWPAEAFEIAIRTGALFRKQGRYREALAALDAFVAQSGAPEGMRMRYHRGWTLQLLGRAAEAVEELDRGLESQPDYAYAFFMRSCAHARLGRLREALADQERGLELIVGQADTNGEARATEIATSRALVETLRRLVAAGRQRPTDAACGGFWERDIRSRPRSALLGPGPR